MTRKRYRTIDLYVTLIYDQKSCHILEQPPSYVYLKAQYLLLLHRDIYA